MASTNNKSPRHLLTVSSFTKEEHELVLATAADIKACPSKYHNACLRMVMLLIFQKPSLRTHVSFEAGFAKMGGHAIYYSTVNSPMGSKETIHDTAKCASRFVEIIGARLKKKSEMHSLAKHATVPTINMLDDWGHPCQILADFLTIKEKKVTYLIFDLAISPMSRYCDIFLTATIVQHGRLFFILFYFLLFCSFFIYVSF
tara:strand:- start:692 stop:1294 length:603 start_codon:yes stop_codon:yes gene_type:complete